MSQSPEDDKKKKESSQSQPQQDKATVPSQNEPTSSPQVSDVSTSTEAKPASPAPAIPKPVASTPVVSRPVTSTPIGKPATSTPVASRPVTSTPVGSPATSTPLGAPGAKPPIVAARPNAVAPTLPTRPTVPTKPGETKKEMSRRGFLTALAVAGGLIAAVQFGQLFPYLQGSVGTTTYAPQVLQDIKTGQTLKTSDISVNNWSVFIYPRTGNPNIDDDTFRQGVVVHLPPTISAPTNLSAKDPISGDTFIAFSRVCVHLWCLWSYVPGDHRGECPCHGSQYVPGTAGTDVYASYPSAIDQPPGMAVGGPASLQTPPNNMLPIFTLSISSDGTISATGLIGQIGYGQKA